METINITDTLSIKDKNSNIPIEKKNLISEELIFENATPLAEDKIIEDKIISDKIISEDKIFENAESSDMEVINLYEKILPKKINKEETEAIIKEDDIFTNAIAHEEPTNWEKMQYGWANNDMVFGNIGRIIESTWESAFDDEKTFKEASLENARIEQEEFEKEYWKFLDGKYDGAYSTIGEAATFILDPYYLAAYTFGAQGEVTSWGDVGVSAGIGAGIGLVLPVGGKLVKKYLPSGIKDKAANISKFIDSKIAGKNKMDPAEVTILRNVANKEPIKKITKQIDELITSPSFVSKGSNFAAPLIKARSDYFNIRTKIAKQLTDIRATKKLTKKTKWGSEEFKATALKAQGKKILDLKLQGRLAKEKWKGRICSRPGSHVYNRALMASIIAEHGEIEAEKWANSLVKNLARRPQGNDRAQVKSIYKLETFKS